MKVERNLTLSPPIENEHMLWQAVQCLVNELQLYIREQSTFTPNANEQEAILSSIAEFREKLPPLPKEQVFRLIKRNESNIMEVVEHACQKVVNPVWIPVDELAERTHMSTSKFRLQFKQVYGMTIYKYFTKLMIERACALLMDEALSVKEVAARMRYGMPAFIRVFKKETGITPSMFRKKSQ